MARKPVIEGDEELYSYYFSDTICGLVEYLDENNILPADVELLALYLKEETLLDKSICTDESGNWLKPPNLCAALEDHYSRTQDQLYKGHVEKHECSFEDREKTGIGAH